MKQIILIRHAKVDIDHSEKIDSASLKNWVALYDTANIHANSLPTQETINIAKNTDVLVTSTLRRAIDSAKVLGVDIYERNAVFNEALIPEISIPLLKLKPKSWLVILRVMLLLGLGKKDASLKASKQQAKDASKRLLALSTKYDSVVLVGHGGMNWLIRKALMKDGWDLEPNASNKNWGMTVLKRADTKE
jgi:broad specificity phosphatase PhoE